MSISHEYADFIFECDGKNCNEILRTETSNFDSAQNVLHRNRWKARKNKSEWNHFCPECQGTLI